MDGTALHLKKLSSSPWINRSQTHGNPDQVQVSKGGTETTGYGEDRVTLSDESSAPQTSNARFNAWHQPNVSNPQPDDRHERQDDFETRNREIQRIGNISNPEDRNRAITASYDQMSHDMRDMLGPDAGANWSTWAAWASSRAGETIRQEDLPATSNTRNVLGGLLAGVPVIGPLLSGGALLANHSYDTSSRAVGEGNQMVYQEIAPQFARFTSSFQGTHAPDEQRWQEFSRGFSPDQADLSQAFRHYYDAMYETDPKRKQELTLLANDQIALHEQRRLDPKINEALPGLGTNGLATGFMHLNLPGESLNLNSDVPNYGGSSFPTHLGHIDNPDLQGFLSRWDRTPNTLSGSAAGNWGSLDDRMNYIVDLMRSRAMDESLFTQHPH